MSRLLEGPPIIIGTFSPRERMMIEIYVKQLHLAQNQLWDMHFGSEEDKKRVAASYQKIWERLDAQRGTLYDLAEKENVTSSREAQTLLEGFLYN